MSYSDRLGIYSKIEAIRGRPLIAYMTSRREFSGGVLGMDVIPELCEHIRKIPKNVKDIDLLIASQGGDPNTAWRIVTVLRERFRKIGVIIPYDAQSAATMLAFGADEIIMHPFSCLGPIDTQITIASNDQVQQSINQFSTDDVKSYLSFIKEDLSIKDEEFGKIALSNLSSELHPTKIGLVKKSMKFTESIASKLLATHISDEDNAKINSIIEKFNEFSHHGYTIGKKEAISLGLPVVKEENEDLNNLIWDAWNDAEREMKCKKPFDPLSIVLSDKNVMDKMKVVSSKIETTSEETKIAIVESEHGRSYFNLKAIVSARRGDNLNILLNVTFTNNGWTTEMCGSDEN